MVVCSLHKVGVVEARYGHVCNKGAHYCDARREGTGVKLLLREHVSCAVLFGVLFIQHACCRFDTLFGTFTTKHARFSENYAVANCGLRDDILARGQRFINEDVAAAFCARVEVERDSARLFTLRTGAALR